MRDFQNVSGIYFQMSAMYTLVNRENGEIHTWSGSFNPQNRVISELTSHSSFQSDSFVPFVLAHSSPDWVFNKLTTGGGQLTAGKTSVWVLDEVKSIVLSFQARVLVSHSFFQSLSFPELADETVQSKAWRITRSTWWCSGDASGSRNKRGFGFQLD